MSIDPQLIAAGVSFAQGLYAQGEANAMNETISNYHCLLYTSPSPRDS